MHKDNMDKDYNDVVKAFEDKVQEDYTVPTELSGRVDQTLKGLKRKHKWYKYPAVAVATLLLMLFAASNLSSEFRAFASTIPGLDATVKWLYLGDEGIQRALDNGYPDLGPVIAKKDGYTIKLENIFVDDTRIHITGRLAGEKVTDKTSVSLSMQDKTPSAGSYENFQRSEGSWSWESDIKVASREEFVKYLKSHNKLVFKATIHENESTVDTLENIEVPYEDGDILYSKDYALNQKVETEYGDITFQQITVSPTRTVLSVHYGEKNGYYINGLTELKLVDDQGNVYEQDGVSFGGKNAKIYFNNSVYFRPKVKSLHLEYSGYTMAQKDGKAFTLPVDIKEPVRIDYMGEVITITDVNYSNNTLRIWANTTNAGVFHIQEIRPLLDSSSSTCGSHKEDENPNHEQLYCAYDSIEKRDVYDVEIAFPRYRIEQSGKVSVDVNH